MRNLPFVWVRYRTLTLDLLPRLRPFSTDAPGGGSVAVKQVTRSNFNAALEGLRACVEESDFVAVDLEMTGVTSAPWRESFEFDRSDVRYLKLKDSAEKFAVVQFGVCPFRWDSSKGSFFAHPHNFYIFPRKELPLHGPPDDFLWQATSIDFLAKYQFDFNACIYEGISYLSREQEGEALKGLSSEYLEGLANSFCNFEEPVDIPIARTSDILFSERMKNKLHKWHDSILRSPDKAYIAKEDAGINNAQFQTVFFKMRPAIMLNGFTSHQLKLIQLVVKKHFNDLMYVRVVDEDNSWQRRVVYVDTNEDKALLMKDVLEDLRKNAEKRIKSSVGFRHVVDLLASAGKLIVGHNCLLDLAHIYNKFFGPLPSSLTEFVQAVHEKFPHIVDTKHLLNSNQTIQSLMKKNRKSLSSAFSLLCPNVSSNFQTTSKSYLRFEVQTDEISSSCFNSGAKHEAGYDAFMTGCVFARACSLMGVKFDVGSPSFDLPRNAKINKYINVLYPSWNSGTVVHLDTGTEFLDPNYKHRYPPVIYANTTLIWGFLPKLKPKDLKECIIKVFGLDSVKSVFFIDRTSALIQFSKEEFVHKFLALKNSLEDNHDLVSVLHPLSKLLEGGNTRAADFDTYRDICAGSASKVLFADQADSLGITWKTKVCAARMQDTEDVCCRETTEDGSLAKHSNGKKNDFKRQSKHQSSYEEIIGSLFSSKTLLERAS
ncbi:poly(A)-specific ribonuclease PARN-like [Zingiber officinale]|uniref:Uncharacterized protein n=1 Tax=Zingiber officinale TaxID=94328 RepID=A0A8J5H4H8_ZINOF|nr:poly(A)-specific ribonuclease PARN-like [Zingiber officinale]KAG6509580.1 hypothetical protein ZIOFF_027580 [Zingiber officinale]